MQISKTLKKVLILALLPFLSLPGENLENLSIEKLKEKQSSRYWSGWALSALGVAYLYMYGSKNFVHVPKLQEDLREHRNLFLYSYYLNSSSIHSAENGANSVTFFILAMSENERLMDKIHFLKANNGYDIVLGIFSITLAIFNFESFYEIKQEIQKKESISFTPQVGFSVNRDSMQVNLTWRF